MEPPAPQQEDAPLPAGWVPCPSTSRPGVVYYYNVHSRATRWSPPPANRTDPTQVRARHILVKHAEVRNPVSKGAKPGQVTRTREEALRIAEELHREVLKAPDRFEHVAKTESDCNSFRLGGDLGKPFKRGDMHKEFSDAAFALDVGEISGVVSSPSGFHVVQRLE